MEQAPDGRDRLGGSPGPPVESDGTGEEDVRPAVEHQPADAGDGRPAGAAGRGEEAAQRALVASLRLVLVPVAVLVLSALGAFAYGAAEFVDLVRKAVEHPFPVGSKIGLFLLLIDLFLIGATLLIAALGFYELFIDRLDDGSGTRRLPRWLQMHDLNDLKARVIAMIVLVAAVSFVEVLVDQPDALALLELGGGVGLVIVALTVFLRYGGGPRGRD